VQQSEGRRLQADNLKLYEKIKYLQSASAANSSTGMLPIGQNSISEEDTEGRYREMYEEKLNPFAAFHKREKQQR
jgi:homeobox protein cut-like